MKVVIILCALVFVSTTADIHRFEPHHLQPGFDHRLPGVFSLGFAIKDEYHADYADEAIGSGVARSGSYRTLLPDGRSQVVNYKLDDHGYMADIKYQTVLDEHDSNRKNRAAN